MDAVRNDKPGLPKDLQIQLDTEKGSPQRINEQQLTSCPQLERLNNDDLDFSTYNTSFSSFQESVDNFAVEPSPTGASSSQQTSTISESLTEREDVETEENNEVSYDKNIIEEIVEGQLHDNKTNVRSPSDSEFADFSDFNPDDEQRSSVCSSQALSTFSEQFSDFEDL